MSVVMVCATKNNVSKARGERQMRGGKVGGESSGTRGAEKGLGWCPGLCVVVFCVFGVVLFVGWWLFCFFFVLFYFLCCLNVCCWVFFLFAGVCGLFGGCVGRGGFGFFWRFR